VHLFYRQGGASQFAGRSQFQHVIRTRITTTNRGANLVQ
jgi:hypothetical protein